MVTIPTKNFTINMPFAARTKTLETSSNLSLFIYKSPKGKEDWTFGF